MKMFELAKELGMTGTKLVERCKAVGIMFSSNQASVDEKQARMIRAMFPPPSREELARRAAAERASKAKAKPKKKKKKKVAKKKIVKKKVAKKKGTAAAAVAGAASAEAGEAALVSAGADAKEPPPAEAAEAREAERAKKKAGEETKAPEPAEPVIKFQYVGEADTSPTVPTDGEAAAEAAGEVEAPAPAPFIQDIPKTRIESLLADRRWEKLGMVARVRSARAQAVSRFGGRSRRRSRRRVRGSRRPAARKIAPAPHGEVVITVPITVRKLSETLGIRGNVLIGKLLEHETRASINDVLAEETAQLIALDYEVDLKVRRERDLEEELEGLIQAESPADELAPRAPVVTFLGHVDHGKTSLLDHIRETNVAEGEAGGITQRIGAYTVTVRDSFLCFIDTPGHEAFTQMRARGAQVTDIAVLVVAADDGVMPQTEEAIDHARAANVPIVVALNKIDLPNANPMRAKQQLAGLELNPEEWGGHTGVVECSAETGDGIDALLERIALEAEVLELKAACRRSAQGFVLESRLTSGRGKVATVLVRDGTLRKGDAILSSHGYGRVRGLFDFLGSRLDEAGPSVPVEVTGLSEIPEAGDRFYVLDDVERAREIAQQRAQRMREAARRPVARHITLEDLSAHLSAGETAELRVILKADVKGALEAILPQLEGLGGSEASINVIHSGVGELNASDVLLAEASDAVCVGFDVGVDAAARRLAEEHGVDVRLHLVIYELVDEVKSALEGKLVPEEREVVTGHAEVRQLFRLRRLGTVAGCYVLDGVVERTSSLRVIREGETVFEGAAASLRHLKDDVREAREGFECGIRIEGFNDLREGDRIEAYHIEQVARKLE